MKLTREQEKIIGSYLEARSKWSTRWLDLYEDHRNVSVANVAIQAEACDSDLQLAELHLWLLKQELTIDVARLKSMEQPFPKA